MPSLLKFHDAIRILWPFFTLLIVRISFRLILKRLASPPNGLLNVAPLVGLYWSGAAWAEVVPATRAARQTKGRTRTRHSVLRTEAVIFEDPSRCRMGRSGMREEPTQVAGSVTHPPHESHHSQGARSVGQAPQAAIMCRNAGSFAKVVSDRVILRPGCA